MKINVFKRKEIENKYLFYDDIFIISITEPGEEKVKIKQRETNILRLEFYDVDKEITDEKGKRYNPITIDQAKEIAKFMRINDENIKELIVQCSAGISRSAGVAAAIAKYYQGNDEWYFKHKVPNRYCYNKVLMELIESDIDKN